MTIPLTKESIQALLLRNDKAVARALLVLNANQTSFEQASESTINRNGMGFRPCHARMGTSMAQFFTLRGYLTPKQVEYWRKPMACGNTKIGIYWKQLVVAANAKKEVVVAETEEDFMRAAENFDNP